MDIYSLEGKKAIIKQYSPKTKLFKNSVLSFVFGGIICLIAELLHSLYLNLGVSEDNVLTVVGITLIILASVLTALGVFDNIARFAGAGTLVPITGFSNAVTSQAMDAKSEGMVLGVGAKIFTIAGPVILYGIVSGIVYGLISFIYLYIIM